MQALREELDTANKKIDRYAHLVAALSEELENLRTSICDNCKQKFVPSYAPRPSLWGRVVSGLQMRPPSSRLPPVSTTNAGRPPNTSIPPITARQNHKETTSAPPQASSSATPSRLPKPFDETRSKQLISRVSHNPNSKRALHVALVKTFNLPAELSCVKFSPDGKYLAAGLRSGKTYIYHMENGRNICCLGDLQLEHSLQRVVWCAQFSSDNKYIATADSDGRVQLWEIARKRMRALFPLDHIVSVDTICFSPNGRFLVAGDRFCGVRIWSLRDGSSKELVDNATRAFAVTFSPDGRHIASVGADGWLRIWDARTGRLSDKWAGHTREGHFVAFSPDGTGLVSGGDDAVLRYWDVSSLAVMEPSRGRVISGYPGQRFQQIRTFKGFSEFTNSLSPDCRWVVSSTMEQRLRIWDSRNAEWQCALRHNGDVQIADFSPAGKYLASGSKDQVSLWRYREV